MSVPGQRKHQPYSGPVQVSAQTQLKGSQPTFNEPTGATNVPRPPTPGQTPNQGISEVSVMYQTSQATGAGRAPTTYISNRPPLQPGVRPTRTSLMANSQANMFSAGQMPQIFVQQGQPYTMGQQVMTLPGPMAMPMQQYPRMQTPQYTITTSQPPQFTMTSERGQFYQPAAQQTNMNNPAMYYPQQNTQNVIQQAQPARPTSTPSSQPDQKVQRKKNIFKITDPNTGRDILEDMSHEKSTTPPHSGPPSSRDTPNIQDAPAPDVDSKEDIAAQFAAQVAATLSTEKQNVPPPQQQMQMAPPQQQQQQQQQPPIQQMQGSPPIPQQIVRLPRMPLQQAPPQMQGPGGPMGVQQPLESLIIIESKGHKMQRKRNIGKITDPNTGRDILEDMHHEKSTTPLHSGQSSSRNTPDPENSPKQQLMEPEMQEVYQKAFLEGTQEVYCSRLMLIGHYSAGKTSLKRTLMHQPFSPDYKSTIGVETAYQTCVVDVETAVNWKQETLHRKKEFKQTVASCLHKRMTADRTATHRQHTAKPVSPELSIPSDKAFAARSVPPAVAPRRDTTHRQHTAKPVSPELSIPSDKATAARSVPPAVAPRRDSKSPGPPDVMPRGMAEFVRDMEAEIVDITSTMCLQDEGCKKAVFVIWDFGGQQLYYTMHQTFLSRRALYLIVMDMSRGLDEEIETIEQHPMWKDSGSPITSRDFLDFWLKSVHTHLIHRGPRNRQSVSPPVVIVCTKKDLLGGDNNARTAKVNQYIQSIRDHLEGKPYYRHVHDIIAISNCEAGDPEVDRLREVIVDVSKKQPYWGEEQPLKWLLLVDRLTEEGAARSEEPVLKLEEVTRIAKEFEVTQEHLSAFLQLYHHLGDLVYFDEAGTSDVVVLSPQWLANMFSKVITHHRLEVAFSSEEHRDMLKQGILSRELITMVPEVKYPHILVKIMEKFDLLVSCDVIDEASAPSQMYLVLCLLQRVMEYQTKKSQIPPIHFKCIPTTELGRQKLQRKGFLPPGLFHRLVADCCQQTVTRWQHHSELIFFDYMVFDAGDFCFALHMVNNGITLSAFDFRGDPLEYAVALNELKEDLQRRIEKILDLVFPNLICTTFLSCDCFQGYIGGSPPPAEALAVSGFIHVKHLSELEGRKACPQHRILLDLRKYQIWFGVDSTVLNTSQLSEDGHKLLTELQPHMTTLLSSWSYKVRGFMMSKGVLNFLEVKEIQEETTTYAQNFKMYDVIFSKVQNKQQARSVKEAICEGLCQSSQVCPFFKEHLPASTEQQDELRRLRPCLMEMPQSDTSEVLKKLQEEGILDDYLREQLGACRTGRDRMHSLLSFISHTHSSAHRRFLNILRDNIWWKFNFEVTRGASQ